MFEGRGKDASKEMTRNRIFCLVFLSTFSLSAIGQTSYLCISDLSVGFSFNKGSQSWERANFNVKNEKFMLSINSSGEWRWKEFGKEGTGVFCGKQFSEHGYLRCESFTQVSFNRKNLRFQSYYPVGYVNKGIVGNEGGDTPAITIGTCSPIN